MNALIDTCDFLWFVSDDPKLPLRYRQAIMDPDNAVFLSAVSTAEIAIKVALKKLVLPEPPDPYIRRTRIRHGINSLPLTEEATLLLAELPPHHKDPFDRMLICQALVHSMTLISSDPKIHKYNLTLL